MPDFSDRPDCLANSILLSRNRPVRREIFNPENQIHIDSLKEFLRTGNWGSVQFYCEAPFTDVPMTVLMTFAMSELGVRRETSEERAARLAAKTLLTEPDAAALNAA